MNISQAISSARPSTWAVIGLYVVLAAGAYWTALTYMVGQWNHEDFNYCYLVPVVVAYLLWEKRDAIAGAPSRPSWAGLPVLVAGILLFWLGELGGEYYSQFLSLWLVLVGLLWLHLGWGKIRQMAFGLAMLLAMFPIPNFFASNISLRLKLVSSQIGVQVMRAMGMTAFREGNVIDVGFTRLQVVDACSGLRYLFPIIILGLLVAYFSRLSLVKRAVLVAISVPIVVVANGLRIAVTGFLYEPFGPAVAEGFFHDFAGWFVFMLSFGLLLAVKFLLARLPGGEGGPPPKDRAPAPGSAPLPPPGPGFRRAAFAASVLPLLFTAIVAQGVEFREKVPSLRPFSEFPLRIGEWTGEREVMEQRFIDTLDFSDYSIIGYRNPAGAAVNFYVAYYESQRKGESIHSPSTCLPGSGWVFEGAGVITVEIPAEGGRTIPVQRAFMKKDGVEQLVYYWFPQRGRILTNPFELKLYAFWDALTRHRTDGALVRVITPVGKNEDRNAADVRLKGFVGLLVPVLDGFLPR